MKKNNFFGKIQRLFDRSMFYKYLLIVLLSTTLVACGENTGEADVQEPMAEEPVAAGTAAVEEWNYENTNWGELGDNECATSVQSPINIQPDDVIEASLPEIEYEYEPFAMRIIDNGHAIQVMGSENSAVVIDDIRYKFLQMHFHAPSEHTLEGESFPLELHLVHRAEGTDNLAVFGVFIEEGDENPSLGDVFEEIPEELETEVETNVSVNLTDFIPESDRYYTYLGSLTTPPCTVGVKWYIFGSPLTASAEQIKAYTDLYDDTARPVQPLNNRRVFTAVE